MFSSTWLNFFLQNRVLFYFYRSALCFQRRYSNQYLPPDWPHTLTYVLPYFKPLKVPHSFQDKVEVIMNAYLLLSVFSTLSQATTPRMIWNNNSFAPNDSCSAVLCLEGLLTLSSYGLLSHQNSSYESPSSCLHLI